MKRKDRKTEPAPNIMEPIGSMMILGGADDPCFGKGHDALNSTCKRCGDAEFCAIVKGQRLHKKRLAQGIFKDDEEANFDIERMEKFMTSSLKKVDKLSLSRLQKMVIDHFKTFEEVDEVFINKMVEDFARRSPKYKKFMLNKIKYLKLK